MTTATVGPKNASAGPRPDFVASDDGVGPRSPAVAWGDGAGPRVP